MNSFTVEIFPVFGPKRAKKWEYLDSERAEVGAIALGAPSSAEPLALGATP